MCRAQIDGATGRSLARYTLSARSADRKEIFTHFLKGERERERRGRLEGREVASHFVRLFRSNSGWVGGWYAVAAADRPRRPSSTHILPQKPLEMRPFFSFFEAFGAG